MIVHFANLLDVSEYAKHHDWPIRPGMTLQNHIRTALTVYHNEEKQLRCDTKCTLTLFVRRSHDCFAFSATIRQVDRDTREDTSFAIQGHMTVYTRVELDENAMEGPVYLPQMFARITGEVTDGSEDVDMSEYDDAM